MSFGRTKARSPKSQDQHVRHQMLGPGSALAGERMDGFRMASLMHRLGIMGLVLTREVVCGWGGPVETQPAKKRPAAYHLACGLLASFSADLGKQKCQD